jgi:hypothetical protein
MLSNITSTVSPLVVDLKPASTLVTLRVKPDRRQFQLEVPAALERRQGLKRLHATESASQCEVVQDRLLAT